MAKYPVSCLDGTAADALRSVLSMHLDGSRVLDLTYGEGLSWRDGDLLDTTRVHTVRGLVDVELTRSDIKAPYNQNIFTVLADRPEWIGAFDLVYYDPPWFVDIGDESVDPRAEAYGGYGEQATSLDGYVMVASSFEQLLRPSGKLVVKCADQYHVPSRRLLLHHIEWCKTLTITYDLVDFFVYRFHRISPTAYQVKNRPCAVVAHSYFIVGQKRV